MSPKKRKKIEKEIKNQEKTREKISFFSVFEFWAVLDLNQRHPACKAEALPLS
jgi:hypothetical protein